MDILRGNFDDSFTLGDSKGQPFAVCAEGYAGEDPSEIGFAADQDQLEGLIISNEISAAKTFTATAQLVPAITILIIYSLMAKDFATLEILCEDFCEFFRTVDNVLASQPFESRPTRVSYARLMHGWLEKLIHSLDLLENFSKLYYDKELSSAKDNGLVPAAMNQNLFSAYPYKGFAFNRAQRPTEDVVARAAKKDLDLKLSFQGLPRGCISIVEEWRKDVCGVVSSILQDNDSNEVKEQDADILGSHFVLERDIKSGRLRKMMKPHVVPHLKRKRPGVLFRREPISCRSQFLLKLVGMERGAHGSHHFCQHMEIYANASGMRAVAEAADEELEDMV